MTDHQKRLAFVIYCYARGYISDFDRRGEAGDHKPDPDIREIAPVVVDPSRRGLLAGRRRWV